MGRALTVDFQVECHLVVLDGVDVVTHPQGPAAFFAVPAVVQDGALDEELVQSAVAAVLLLDPSGDVDVVPRLVELEVVGVLSNGGSVEFLNRNTVVSLVRLRRQSNKGHLDAPVQL